MVVFVSGRKEKERNVRSRLANVPRVIYAAGADIVVGVSIVVAGQQWWNWLCGRALSIVVADNGLVKSGAGSYCERWTVCHFGRRLD